LDNPDLLLLEKIRQDKQTAFDELFRKYYRKLVYFSMKITKNQDSANEVVQDLFVNLWEKRKQLEPKVSVRAYLYRAVFNNSIHIIQKEKKYQGEELNQMNEKSEFFEDLMETAELETKIYDLIGQLPKECQRIFKMSRFEELKYQEIADNLNLSVKTVETQMSRALKFLRSHLVNYFMLLIYILLR
jgi:RNA polymerase sigma-70 factor (family 1)